MIEGKGFGRKRPYPNRGTILTLAWRDRGKPRNPAVRIAGVLVEIRVDRLPVASGERYRYTDLLGIYFHMEST
jgi:hypothetical protein